MASNDYARVEKAIRYLDAHFRRQPTLGDLASGAGLSEYHFQRLFRRWAGISPKRFLQCLTTQYTGALLRDAVPSLDAAYEAGLSSVSRLHDLYLSMHAMTPAQYRDHGAALDIRYGFHDTPFGECLIGVTDIGICWLGFVATDRTRVLAELQREWRNARLRERPRETGAVVRHVFATRPQRPLTLHVHGTNFQVRVWEALLRIPPGAVASYGDVASRLGRPTASRAVGSAVAHNPVSYLIPCHRVIQSTGAVGNYRWGVARKRVMLGWEAAHAVRAT